MNCIPGMGSRRKSSGRTVLLLASLSVGFTACDLPVSYAEDDESDDERVYELEYRVTIDPEAKGARVEMVLTQEDDYLREVSMSLRDGRIGSVSGDGDVSISDDGVVWLPPEDGGSLRWFVRIDHLRSDDSYDAYVADDWALFRGEDIIPSAHTRTQKGAESKTSLTFELPEGWSSVTPYFGNDDTYKIDKPDRRFDTPTGWMVLGDLGVRIETIAGVRTKVAGPVDQGIRRMDILAFLRWTLPELLDVLPDFPDRLTIVSAGKPMWRGALSAPQSFYIHADRPLISGNGTSSLLHEVMHIGLGVSAERGADWIVEGLAEYYGLEILRRSGTISNKRYRIARDDLAAWGRETEDLCGRESSGSKTALAVTILAELDDEIEDATDGDSSLDDVLPELKDMDEKVTVERFREIVTDIADAPMDALDEANLPGCG